MVEEVTSSGGFADPGASPAGRSDPPKRHRAQQGVAKNLSVHNRDQRQQHSAVSSQGVDEATFVRLAKGDGVHAADRLDVSRTFRANDRREQVRFVVGHGRFFLAPDYSPNAPTAQSQMRPADSPLR
jgi:hypothetical protein